MLFTTALISIGAIALQAGIASGVAVAPALNIETGLPKGYTVSVAEFSIPYAGKEIKLNGTIQDVWAQLETKYPDAANHFIEAEKARNASGVGAAVEVNKRNKIGQLYCSPGYLGWVAGFAVDLQMDHLTRLGDTRVSIDARSCARISCNSNASIEVCNDNNFRIKPSVVYMASYASDIRRICKYNGTPAMDLVGGQEFDTDFYNVLIRNVYRCS